MINEYEYKYKKYKIKYLNLKQTKNIMSGGGDIEIDKIMYIIVGGKPLLRVYIPEEELFPNVDIHKLFEKYGIHIKIDGQLDLETLRIYSKDNKDKYENYTDPITKYTHIANLSKLFEGAKEIMMKYLPLDNEDYDNKQKWFRRDDEILRRIFSHHYEKVIVLNNPNEYDKIKFPERILLIRDPQGTRLTREETIRYIDSNLKLSLYYDGSIYFEFYVDGYKTFNYTTYIEEFGKKQSSELSINHKAYDQMIKLCEELVTVDYTPHNVHYEDGFVYVKDLKNKGQYRCPTHHYKEIVEKSWEDFLKELEKMANIEESKI